jgi:threonine dehydrogenase-like Zn-dependent dehydrogenase
VLVVGVGAIGLLWTQVLEGRGDHVVVLDPRRERVERALELGGQSDDDPVAAAVVTAHGGLNEALRRVEPGGMVVVFAAPDGELPTNVDAIYRKELAVVGSRSATPAFFRAAAELLPTLVLPQITTLPLDRFVEGVELYSRGEVLKVVFTP